MVEILRMKTPQERLLAPTIANRLSQLNPGSDIEFTELLLNALASIGLDAESQLSAVERFRFQSTIPLRNKATAIRTIGAIATHPSPFTAIVRQFLEIGRAHV